jgi:hypothetical protein
VIEVNGFLAFSSSGTERLISFSLAGLSTINNQLSTFLPLPHRLLANGADGISDMEGKVTRVGASKPGGERVSMERPG